MRGGSCNADTGICNTPTASPATHTPTATQTPTATATFTPGVCAAGGSLTSTLRLCKPLYQTPDWHTWVNGNMDLIDAIFDDSGAILPEYSGLPMATAAGQIPFATAAGGQSLEVGELYFADGRFGTGSLPTTAKAEFDLSAGDYDERYVKLEGGSNVAPLWIGQMLDDFGVPLVGGWSLGLNSIPYETTAVGEVGNSPSWSLDLQGGLFQVRYTPLLQTAYSTAIKATLFGNAGVWTTDPQSGWHVPDGKYLQAEDNSAGEPPKADCNEASEFGRVTFNTVADEICWCDPGTETNGLSGWRCRGTQEIELETTWDPVGSATFHSIGLAMPAGMDSSEWYEWTCSATLSSLGLTGTRVISVRPRGPGEVSVAVWDATGLAMDIGLGHLRVRCSR